MDIVLVDKHDYHTFQPLLYQLATGLLETSAVGHSLRDLVHARTTPHVHKTTVTAIDLEAREVRFAELEPLTYDYLVLALGAEVNFFGTEGAAEHAFPMYTLPDAVRPQGARAAEVGSGRQGPGARRRRRAERRRRRRRPDRRRDAPARWPSSTAPTSRRTTRTCRRSRRRITLVEAGPEIFAMFKPDLRAYTRRP